VFDDYVFYILKFKSRKRMIVKLEINNLRVPNCISAIQTSVKYAITKKTIVALMELEMMVASNPGTAKEKDKNY